MPHIATKICCRRYKIQHFNAVSSQTSGSLLLLSAIGIIIPTAAQRLGTTGDEEAAGVLGMLAQGMAQDKVGLPAVVLLTVYIGYLIAQLGTHKVVCLLLLLPPLLQILLLSSLTAVALLTVYISFFFFQLGTHKDMCLLLLLQILLLSGLTAVALLTVYIATSSPAGH
jgi:Ca2+/H+ antiporter